MVRAPTVRGPLGPIGAHWRPLVGEVGIIDKTKRVEAIMTPNRYVYVVDTFHWRPLAPSVPGHVQWEKKHIFTGFFGACLICSPTPGSIHTLLPPPPGGRIGQKPSQFFRTKIFTKNKKTKFFGL